jgi:hypothetical protein
MVRFLFVVAVVACAFAYRAGRISDDGVLHAANADGAQVPIEEIVLGVLTRDRQWGSLAYRGYCGPSGVVHYSFRPAPSQDATSSLEALRKVFANDPEFVVQEDSSGLIRISNKAVARDLLNVKISNFSFKGEYDPKDAVRSILQAPEVITFMQNHHVQFEPSTGTIGIAPGKNLPQLKGRMENVSVSQLLDRILQTFPGLWIYKECVQDNGERFVDFEFQFAPPKGLKP